MPESIRAARRPLWQDAYAPYSKDTMPTSITVQFRTAPGRTHARKLLMPVAAAGIALILSGCAAVVSQSTQPVQVQTPLEIPSAWSATAQPPQATATSLAQWWSRFDDPLLTALVSRSLQANTSITNAQAVLRQAQALRDGVAVRLLPTLDVSASAQRGKSGDNKSAGSYQASLNANWEPDFFGVNRSAVNASDASVLASAASLGDVQVAIAAEVALSYITLRNAQMRLAIAEANLSSQLETLQITQWRLQAGLVSSLEVEQSRTAIEQTRAQLPALQTSIEQTRHALALLTGQPPASLLTVLAAAAPVPQAADDLILNFPAETLRQRPDVRAAEHQVTAALAQLSQADAARKPSFRLGGSLGLSALTLGALTDGASLVSSLLAGVSLPLFDGGAAHANIRAEQAALEQAQAAYRATVLSALQEVEDALVALRGDRERLQRLQQAAEAADNAALMAHQRYESGLVDFQVVLETQRSLLSTQDSVASTRADLAADHVRLYTALGGGWSPDSLVIDIAETTRTDLK